MSLFRQVLSLPSTVEYYCFLLGPFHLLATANIDSLFRFGCVLDIVQRRKAEKFALAGNFALDGNHAVKFAGRRTVNGAVNLQYSVELVCLIVMAEGKALESLVVHE